jgi:hypothetical protein
MTLDQTIAPTRAKLYVRTKRQNLDRLRDTAMSQSSGWDGDRQYSYETYEQYSDRLTVNFIRHERSNYDDLLDDGHDRDTLRRKVLRMIGERYPPLMRECARQGADMTGYRLEVVPNEKGILQRFWRKLDEQKVG